MKTKTWMKVITMLLIITIIMTSMPTTPVLAYKGTETEENDSGEMEALLEGSVDVLEFIEDDVKEKLELDEGEDSIEIIEEMQGNEFVNDMETVFSDEEEIQGDPLIDAELLDADGNIASGSSNEVYWKIDAEGTLTISGNGKWTVARYEDQYGWVADWYEYAEYILKAEVDLQNATSLVGMFNGCRNLESITFIDLNTDDVTNMNFMFSDCASLTSLDVSNFDTSNVMRMSYMFSGCSNLENLDVSNFDTSNVTDMDYMFSGCSSLTSLDISNFDTSKVTGINGMFFNCTDLTSLDVSNFNTSKVTGMGFMFSGCTGLISLDVSNFDTSNVTNMIQMFFDCISLTSLDVSNFDTTNVTFMEAMFSGCTGLTSLDVSNFDTTKVTDMRHMFSDCSGLTSLDVSNFDTSKVTNMEWMFYNCSRLDCLDISNFDLANVIETDGVFTLCNSLKLIYTPINCQADTISLYATYEDKDGEEYNYLPSLNYSIAIKRQSSLVEGEDFPDVESKPTHTITVTQPENGTITPETVTVTEGINKTFFITPSDGYRISALLVDGKEVEADAQDLSRYMFKKVSDDHTITAEFEEISSEEVTKYTVKVRPSENGKLTPSSAKVEEGGSKTFTIQPDEGYEISKLIIDGKTIDAEGLTTYELKNVTKDMTIEAVFEKIPVYSIRVTQSANGVIDTKDGDIPAEEATSTVSIKKGEDKEFTITPDEGYIVYDLLINGESVEAADLTSYTFKNVTKDSSITAVFKKKEDVKVYTIKTVSGSNYTVEGSPYALSANGSVSVNELKKETITFKPASGHKMNNIYVTKGGAVSADVVSVNSIGQETVKVGYTVKGSSVIFHSVSADYTVSADTVSDNSAGGTGGGSEGGSQEEQKKTYVFTVTVAGGTAEGSPAALSENKASVEEGKDETITLKGEEGLVLQTLKIDGREVISNGKETGADSGKADADSALPYTISMTGGKVDILFKSVNANHAVDAVFAKQKITVSLNVPGLADRELTVGEPYGELPEPSKEAQVSQGQVFAGWMTKDGKAISADSIVDAKDGALIPIWHNYTIEVKQKMDLTDFFKEDLAFIKANEGTKYKFVVHTQLDAARPDAKGDNKLGSVAAKTGVFTAKKAGTAVVEILMKKKGDKGFTSNYSHNKLTISIVKPAPVKKVTLTYEKQTKNVEEYLDYVFEKELGYGSNYSRITYTSTKESVLKVDGKTGVVTAVGSGSAKVVAHYATKLAGVEKEIKVNIPITVKIPKFKKTEIPVKAGKSVKQALLNAEKKPAVPVVWTSSDEKVATVDQTGKVSAQSAGTAIITAVVTNPDKTTTPYSYKLNVQ